MSLKINKLRILLVLENMIRSMFIIRWIWKESWTLYKINYIIALYYSFEYIRSNYFHCMLSSYNIYTQQPFLITAYRRSYCSFFHQNVTTYNIMHSIGIVYFNFKWCFNMLTPNTFWFLFHRLFVTKVLLLLHHLVNMFILLDIGVNFELVFDVL